MMLDNRPKEPVHLLLLLLLGRAAAFCPDSHASNCAFPRPRPAPARAHSPTLPCSRPLCTLCTLYPLQPGLAGRQLPR